MFTIQARDRGLGIGGNGRMSAESGYVHDGGRMEVGHRLEVAGALLVWRRESTYLAGESGKGRGGAMYMLGARGLLRGGRCWNVVPGAGGGHLENWRAPSSPVWMEHGVTQGHCESKIGSRTRRCPVHLSSRRRRLRSGSWRGELSGLGGDR